MLPLLALIPGILWAGTKAVGTLAENHVTTLIPLLENLLSNNPTAKKIVETFEGVVGKIDEQKKYDFQLE